MAAGLPPAAAPPDAAAVADAARRIAGRIVATPLLASPLFDARVGGRVLLKAEGLQRAGSFKYRGALNRLLALDGRARDAGVVAFPRGNHVLGVAQAGRDLGVRVRVVMSAEDPPAKIAAVGALGAEVTLVFGRGLARKALDAALRARAEQLAAKEGGVLIPPYDDPWVIAGHGTVGLELAEQAAAMGRPLDAVLVPCGRGGLAAGVALALEGRSPATRVFTVEPVGYDDAARSFVEGRLVENAPAPPSVCDGLLPTSQGAVSYAINRRLLAGGVAVDDTAALAGVAAAFADFKVVAEPSGAIGLGALLAGAWKAEGRTVGVICSGANVLPEVLRQALAEGRR